MQEHVQRSEYQRNRAEQLDEHVERGACGILERITNGVTNHASFVRFAFLTENSAGLVETVNHLAFCVHPQITCFDILLRVVPCATAVVEEQSKNDTTHCPNHQHACFRLRSQNGTY